MSESRDAVKELKEIGLILTYFSIATTIIKHKTLLETEEKGVDHE